MKQLPTPAEMEARLHAIVQRRNAHAHEKDSSTKRDHGSWLGSRTRDHETMSLVTCSTQVALNESYSALEKYGDIMGVVDNHPLFKRAIQQWGVYPQALTQACKAQGVEAVLEALRYTANYKAAKKPGSFLFAVLRNGKKA